MGIKKEFYNLIDFKLKLETKSFALIQIKDSHFEDLYLVASNPIVWEQHPENDRWKKEVFSNFFQTAIKNELGCFTILDKNIDKLITKETGLPVVIAEDPLSCVALGTGKALDQEETFSTMLVN